MAPRFQQGWKEFRLKIANNGGCIMKNQILSIDQMQELVALGIDTSKASIYWEHKEFGVYEVSIDPYAYNNPIPAFTLQDILLKLPRVWEIGAYNANRNTITVFLDDETGNCHQEISNSLLEAAFNMLKWCKQNNYI